MKKNEANIAQIYWQLVIIIILPHFLTFLRSAFVGVIGKTNSAYPWPRRSALLAVRQNKIAVPEQQRFVDKIILSYINYHKYIVEFNPVC